MRLPPTSPARFVARPNRFAVEAELVAERAPGPDAGELVRCFCPSPGRLGELLVPGAALRVAPAERPAAGARTTHDLLLVRHRGAWVGVDTRLAGQVFREAQAAGALRGLAGPVASEVRVGGAQGPRLDFRIATRRGPAWVEVKAVNLVEEGVARFPDAPSARAARHADALAARARDGERAVMAFVVLRPDARAFEAHETHDPAFAAALRRAVRVGVEVRAWACATSAREVRLAGTIPVRA